MLDVLPEDPELGIVLKCNKAALSGGAHLSEANHKTELQLTRTDRLCVCVCVCYPLDFAQVVKPI